MDGLTAFFVYPIVIGIIIFLLSMLFREKRIILPLITCMLSLLFIMASFLFASGWEGLDLLFIGICILVASLLNILL
ncbi:YesK family protein [Oceanobacillus sp. CFH 90083]|uniref:YesK family protein n=1 Tax=Oceanobacillus sp. CFH 90083 TaxID=2592336 RepID=UPI00128D777B|nr:YesK family protein [Oceanobacillus sp. CFH 90083]